MTKIFKFINRTAQKIGNKVASAINAVINKTSELAIRAKYTLASARGEGYVDSGVKILIAVVIGALLLGLLYSLFEDTIMPTVTAKIKELFNFKG